MYNEKRNMLFTNYNNARKHFIENPHELIAIEKYVASVVNKTINDNYAEIERDYNEATYLNAFWANYPPDDRGRAPVGDQVPWIEVGEHSVGHKLTRIISAQHQIAEVGLPSGADNRVILIDKRISELCNGYTDRVFLFLDIKSVGPRDNFDHTVISPYQVSGDGMWNSPLENMVNSPMTATGRSVSHIFYPAIAPIYALSDGNVAPTIHLFVKPVYKMMSLSEDAKQGQPLDGIKDICVPNGLLISVNPNYLQQHPGLFFPGKDDKKKDPKKIRVRVSFDILRNIEPWRVSDFDL